MTFEYKIPTKRITLPPFQQESPPSVPAGRPPRIARLVALAHRLEALVRTGQVKDYGALAELAHVSPARIAQVAVLAQLAPEIQEYVLFLSPEHAGKVTESELREIAREHLWSKQQALFGQLLQRRS